jgi:hypothetical protein
MRTLVALFVASGLLAAGCVSIDLPGFGPRAPEPVSAGSPTRSSPVVSEAPPLPPAPTPPPVPAPPEVVRPVSPAEPVLPAPPRRVPAAPEHSPVAKPAPPVLAPGPVEPVPPPPPPVVAARVPHEDQVAQEVNTRLAKTQEIISKIDGTKLSRDQRVIFSSIQDFLTKAKDAYQAKDMSRAQVLAEKASKLADDLAGSIKR